jgi:hypothetical protein
METKSTNPKISKKKKPTKKVIRQDEILAPESTPHVEHKPFSFFEKIKKFLGL